MSKLSEKISYIKGLMEGYDFKAKDPESKILSEILEALEMASTRLDYVEESVDELDDYVEEIDNDLGELEDYVTGEDECDDDDCCCHHNHDYDDEDDEEEITYECPSCGSEVELASEGLMSQDMPKCPECGEPLFEEE